MSQAEPDLNSLQTPLTIHSDGIRLEGLLHLPDAPSGKAPGVVMCHPHPRQGGDMHSSVVTGVADRLARDGIAVLRFNFRGVGDSEGQFAWGSGETDDAEAALDLLELREEVDASRVGIAGYSFGAAVALQAAMGSGVPQAVAAIACPSVQLRDFSGLEILPPKLFIMGDNDRDFPVDQFRFLSRRFANPRRAEVVPGADHFFRGHEDVVAKLTSEFFGRWLRQ